MAIAFAESQKTVCLDRWSFDEASQQGASARFQSLAGEVSDGGSITSFVHHVCRVSECRD